MSLGKVLNGVQLQELDAILIVKLRQLLFGKVWRTSWQVHLRPWARHKRL